MPPKCKYAYYEWYLFIPTLSFSISYRECCDIKVKNNSLLLGIHLHFNLLIKKKHIIIQSIWYLICTQLVVVIVYLLKS